MTIPDVLALDFDGVLCDGMREYFETSRRTCARAWPDESIPGDELFAAFRRLPGLPRGTENLSQRAQSPSARRLPSLGRSER